MCYSICPIMFSNSYSQKFRFQHLCMQPVFKLMFSNSYSQKLQTQLANLPSPYKNPTLAVHHDSQNGPPLLTKLQGATVRTRHVCPPQQKTYACVPAHLEVWTALCSLSELNKMVIQKRVSRHACQPTKRGYEFVLAPLEAGKVIHRCQICMK